MASLFFNVNWIVSVLTAFTDAVPMLRENDRGLTTLPPDGNGNTAF
jgi:hypothetical protein